MYGLLVTIAGPIFWFMIGFTAFESGSTGRYVCIMLGIANILYGLSLFISSPLF